MTDERTDRGAATPALRRIVLVLDPAAEPISGSLAVGADAPTAFIGWLELAAMIESARLPGEAER